MEKNTYTYKLGKGLTFEYSNFGPDEVQVGYNPGSQEVTLTVKVDHFVTETPNSILLFGPQGGQSGSITVDATGNISHVSKTPKIDKGQKFTGLVL